MTLRSPFLCALARQICRGARPLAILVALGLVVELRAASAATAAPNVVILLADDLGWSDLGVYGSPHTKTPHLDGLAAAGARFTDFYAGSGVCSPSRATLMTGRFALRAGVYSWIHPSHRMHLRVAEATYPEALQGAGYATAHVGKWHLGYGLEGPGEPGRHPGGHGFDHWLATGNNAEPSHENPINFYRNGVAVGPTEGYSSQLVVDEALAWLAQRDARRPFLLNVWFHEPHARVAAPERFRARHLDTQNPDYYGCIENMDDAIGRLLARLDEMGVAQNTLVVFASDNGSYLAGSNGELRGRKTSLWEGGIRVPAIWRWPGRIKPGTVMTQPAGLVDVLPTILGAAGVPLPAGRTLDGVALQPLFAGRALARSKPLYWFYNPSRPVAVIRDGDWNMVADPDRELSRDNMFRESFIGDIKATELVNFRLYNLRTDPGQQHDLAAAEPARFAAMKRQLIALNAEVLAEAWDWRTDTGPANR